MEEYRINFRNQYKVAIGGMGLPIICIAILVYFSVSENVGKELKDALYLVFSIIALIHLVPQIALHINYYMINRHDVFRYNALDSQFFFRHNDMQVEFSQENVRMVEFHKSFALFYGNTRFLSTDDYNHVIIDLIDGRSIILTSLMFGGEILIPVSEDKKKNKLNIFRWVNGSSFKNAK